MLLCATQGDEGLEQAYYAGSGIVASQAIELSVALQQGLKGLLHPACHRLYRVDVRVEQQGRSAGVESG